MKTDKLLQLIQQKRVMRSGGALPLPKHQGTDKSETGYHFPLWAIRNPALLLSGFLGSDKENTQPEPVVEKPTRAPFNYDLYNDRASAYLSRPVFEGTPLTGQLIADSARDFYNQTGYEYPLDLLLSQAQFETSMGRKLKSKNNFFNVGNYDDGRTLDYKTPQESLGAYMNLIYNDYLNKGKVPADQLLQPGKFVNIQGKRYASNPDYEKNLANQSSVIKKTWAEKINKKKNAEKAFGGHIASYQSLGETNEDNNKPKEIRNYVSVPPNTIFPDKAWTSDIIDRNTGVYTMRAETSVPQIFGSTVTALNPKKSSWTQEQNFGANTEGIVEKLELTGDSLGPNLYRETGTVCRKPNGEVVPECASGVQLAMDYGTDFGGENRKKLGITGDAWTMGQNVVDAGGSRYYNLLGEGLDKSSLHSNKQVRNYLEDRKTELGIKPLDVYNSAQAGDLVEMWYENSPSQSKALREGNGAITTHIGIVSVKDGKKYVTHNIHGHWESNPLEKALRKMNVKHGTAVMVSGLVRPDYMDNSKALETVGVQINPEARVYSGSSEETKRNPKETKWKTKTPLSRESQIFTRNLAYYAPQIQQDFGFSDSEMEELMKTSFGLFGKESGFGEGDKFKKKQKFRKLIGKYKDISPDWDYEGDEMSVGKGQIKMDEVFNTPEKKALLEKYGITKDNIWDTGNSAAALLLTTAMNYKNLSSLLGTTFENTDAITLKNILALSHNKGLETVINNEFISKEGDKRRGVEKLFHLLKGDKNWNNDWDESPTMDATSILEGLRTYSDLHLNPESYSNIFEDYAASLNVNYNKVKENFANKENFQPRTESIPGTIVDAATQGIDNIVTGAQNEVESVVDKGERGVRKMARVPKKVISKIKKELRGTPIFQTRGQYSQLERDVNKWLDYPMDRAVSASEDFVSSEEDPVDNIRHAFAGMYTSDAIASKFPNWLQYTGVPQLAGFLGANALGLAHEASNISKNPKRSLWDKIREAGEDSFNNFMGTVVKDEDALRYLSYNNYLADGISNGDADMYFKDNPSGPINNTVLLPSNRVANPGFKPREIGKFDENKFKKKVVSGFKKDGGSAPKKTGQMTDAQRRYFQLLINQKNKK